MGAFLLAAGTKGKRFALPNSRIMIHQPMGGVQGQASDIEIHAKEILYLRRAPERDPGRAHRPAGRAASRRTPTATTSCPAEDAVSYGLVDKILSSRGEQRLIVQRV